jgi:exosortase/archaeosortase family protein
MLKGIDIWINPHYKLIITKACNGMIPFLFVMAAILSYPSKILHKILWIFLSHTILTLVNTIRILVVVHFVQSKGGRENFEWSHDFLGNFILISVSLVLFILYIKTRKIKD